MRLRAPPLLTAATMLATIASAQVRLPHVFSDHDVLWEVYLRPEPAGGPSTLTVRGSAPNAQPITVSDLWKQINNAR